MFVQGMSKEINQADLCRPNEPGNIRLDICLSNDFSSVWKQFVSDVWASHVEPREPLAPECPTSGIFLVHVHETQRGFSMFHKTKRHIIASSILERAWKKYKSNTELWQVCSVGRVQGARTGRGREHGGEHLVETKSDMTSFP